MSLDASAHSELGEDPRRLLLDNGRVLRLSSLNHDLDTGVYQCNASNPLGYVYANAFVNVKGAFSLILEHSIGRANDCLFQHMPLASSCLHTEFGKWY